MEHDALPTPTPTPPPEPVVVEAVIPPGLMSGIESLLGFNATIGAFIDDLHSGAFFGKLLLAAVGALAQFLWDAGGGALSGGSSILTQLPPAWSYELAPVVAMRAVMQPIGYALLGLAAVLAVVTIAVGLVVGRPFGAVLNAIPRYLLAAAGLVFAAPLVQGWIDFANAASARLLDPATGLPGMGHVQSFDQLAGVGLVALVYLFVGLLFFLARIKLVILAALLLITAPLAIAAGALPFALAERFFSWWLTTLIAVTFVHVLQAVCLGLGAALMAQPTQTGAISGDAEAVMSVALGVGSITAALSVPGLLLGSLGRAEVGGRLLNAAYMVGMLASSSVAAAGASRLASVAQAARMPRAMPAAAPVSVAPLSGGYTHSLLGGRNQLLLPPPGR